jgi:hypothetical protein
MTHRHLTCKECHYHSNLVNANNDYENRVCGCPRTKRTSGLYVYKNDLTGNWVVWDVEGHNWLSLSGSWQQAINTANLYLKHYQPEPVRCQTWCSDYPDCQHDWRKWHIVVNSDS